jgi:TolB-like protein
MDYLKSGLSNSLVTSLGVNANDSFSIVERSQFESLLKEMGLASTGIVDVSTATKIGNALGATEVVVGGIVKLGNTFRLNIRVINVKTSKLQSAFTEYTNSEGDILKLIDKIAYQIVQSLSQNDPIISIEQSKLPSPVLVSPIQVSPTPFPVSENNQTTANFEIPTWVWISGGAVLLGVIIISNMSSREPTITPLPPVTPPYYNIPSAPTTPLVPPMFNLNTKF